MYINLLTSIDIEILDEPFYTLNSTDNKFIYPNIYGSNISYIPTTKHGIKIRENQNIISSCLIFGFAGQFHNLLCYGM